MAETAYSAEYRAYGSAGGRSGDVEPDSEEEADPFAGVVNTMTGRFK